MCSSKGWSKCIKIRNVFKSQLIQPWRADPVQLFPPPKYSKLRKECKSKTKGKGLELTRTPLVKGRPASLRPAIDLQTRSQKPFTKNTVTLRKAGRFCNPRAEKVYCSTIQLSQKIYVSITFSYEQFSSQFSVSQSKAFLYFPFNQQQFPSFCARVGGISNLLNTLGGGGQLS